MHSRNGLARMLATIVLSSGCHPLIGPSGVSCHEWARMRLPISLSPSARTQGSSCAPSGNRRACASAADVRPDEAAAAAERDPTRVSVVVVGDVYGLPTSRGALLGAVAGGGERR